MVLNNIDLLIAQKMRLLETFPNLYSIVNLEQCSYICQPYKRAGRQFCQGLAELPANSATCHDHFN
jgi:hypothetical protein